MADRPAVAVILDVLSAAGVVLCLPFVILAVATPVALCAALVVWIIGRF